MEKENLELKLRVPRSSLYAILLQRLEACKKQGKDIIRFPEVISKIAVSFSIPKQQVFELLFLLHDLNIIQIVCGHGVRLNYGIKNE
jgi:hypothetical protein